METVSVGLKEEKDTHIYINIYNGLLLQESIQLVQRLFLLDKLFLYHLCLALSHTDSETYTHRKNNLLHNH